MDERRPPLPYIQRPPGAAFWLGTWTGRLVLINAAVFVVISIMSQSLLMPNMSTLLDLGAKDPVGLARGEWWRFVTPVFLHIGILHFAVNTYMLYQIGYQIEAVLGAWWFPVVYLLAGIGGNVSSAVLSANLSAGASGALFGLLGAGFYIERSVGKRMTELTGRKQRNRVYAMTVLINLIIGLIIPFIDNAAHIGGLIVGMLLTMAMVNIKPNRLHAPRPFVARAIVLGLLAALLVGGKLATSPAYALDLLLSAADREDEADGQLHYVAQASRLAPDDPRVVRRVEAMIEALEKDGRREEAQELREYFSARRSLKTEE